MGWIPYLIDRDSAALTRLAPWIGGLDGAPPVLAPNLFEVGSKALENKINLSPKLTGELSAEQRVPLDRPFFQLVSWKAGDDHAVLDAINSFTRYGRLTVDRKLDGHPSAALRAPDPEVDLDDMIVKVASFLDPITAGP